MAFPNKILRTFFPRYLRDKEIDQESEFRYKRIWTYFVILTSLVALAPLIFMTILNINHYQETIEIETRAPITALASNAKRSIEFYLQERQAALNFIIKEESFERLSDENNLAATFYNLKQAVGGFIDLGFIDSDGIQRSYVGPYELHGRNYKGQDWFNEISLRDLYVSDVFMGFRGFPHFVIAVKHHISAEDFYVLRATIDTEVINRQIKALDIGSASDAFLINNEGMLQTESHLYGKVLEKYPLDVPRYSSNITVTDEKDKDGNPLIRSYAYIDQSPFIFIVTNRPEEIMKNWIVLRNELLGFLIISIFLIVMVVLGSSTYMVNKLREADLKRAEIVHNLQYTNKMASIGRLAAGIAHEINNPLAIINQKAGLLQDIVDVSETFPKKEKFQGIISSILQSVDRCSTITHRFLGFAKRLDLKTEPINLESLLNEVLGFLGKEALFRNITINFHVEEDIPDIESDRGRLQQVFLNIINNAFAASDDGGTLDIYINKSNDAKVAVRISDTGHGISEDHLNRIFEPFYTSKEEGTGLGLSITYSLVEKLGGDISVKSKVGEGTSFTVTLPVKDESFK